jgi:hypothetical protein
MRVSSVVAYWTRTHAVIESDPVNSIYVFLSTAMFFHTLYLELLNRSCVVFENILPSTSVRLYCRWRWCGSNLTSSFVCHVCITNDRKLKRYEIWVDANGRHT